MRYTLWGSSLGAGWPLDPGCSRLPRAMAVTLEPQQDERSGHDAQHDQCQHERAAASFHTVTNVCSTAQKGAARRNEKRVFPCPATGDCPALVRSFLFAPPCSPCFPVLLSLTGLQDLDRHAPPAPPPPPTGAPGWSGTSGLVPLPVHGASTPVPLVIGFAQHDLTCPAPWAGIPRTLPPPKHRTTAGPTITHPNPLPTTASLPFSVLRLHNNPPSTKVHQTRATLPLSTAKADPISNHRHSLDQTTTTLLTAGNCLSWTPRPKNAESQAAPQSIDDDSPEIQRRSQFTSFPRSPLNRVDKIRPRCRVDPSPQGLHA